MDITGLSGYFDGYNWHQGPFKFKFNNSRIIAIEKYSGNDGDIHLDGHMASIPFVDGHTHLIFSGDRSFELSMKIEGKSYAEILESGGGILNTVKSTRTSDDETLLNLVLDRLDLMLKSGTLIVKP